MSEALRLRPALVLTELRLSGLGGLEAARRVLAQCPGHPTSSSSPRSRTTASRRRRSPSAPRATCSRARRRPSSWPALRAAAQGRAGAVRAPGRRAPRGAAGATLRPRGRLSPRANEVVRLLAEGHSMKQAAAALGIARARWPSTSPARCRPCHPIERGARALRGRLRDARPPAARRRSVSTIVLTARVVAHPPPVGSCCRRSSTGRRRSGTPRGPRVERATRTRRRLPPSGWSGSGRARRPSRRTSARTRSASCWGPWSCWPSRPG